MDSIGEVFYSALRQAEDLVPLALVARILGALFVAFAIIVAFNAVQFALGRAMKNRVSPQKAFVVRKAVKLSGLAMAALSLFGSMGVNTSALLGAAGVIGIAVGFAAQTTVSSFISGFFLLSEKPFQVGDVIRADGLLGEVLSVDTLSVKIRTYDNLYARIPNETLFRSSLVNLSRFPVRRLDVLFNAPFEEDLERLRGLLMEIAAENPYALDNPPPNFRVDQIDPQGPLVNFNVWFEKSQLLEIRTSMYMAVLRRFAEERIAIPRQRLEVRVADGSPLAPPQG